MGHIVRIRSKEQYIAALGVLDYVEGTWHARGPASDPVLLLTDKQFNALVEAGVVRANDKEVQPGRNNSKGVKTRGKKATGKKAKS